MKLFTIIFLFLCLGINAAAEKVQGYVFADKNENGIQEKGEHGILGVWISNQKDFVQTDKNGYYEIERLKNKAVYVVKPAAYNVKKYYSLSETQCNFALFPKEKKHTFEVLVVGDPQMRIPQTLNAFQEDIVQEMLNYQPEFAIVLGDIADNDLTMYPQAKEILQALPYPTFPVFGNHDVNYSALSAEQEADVFQQYWGADYYTFNEGDIHFIVLNNVLYNGWNKKNNTQGDYFGGISDTQYEWLKKDISLVEKDKLIVLCMHIPLLEQYSYPKEIQRIFSLLHEHEHLLALSGHLHAMENYFFNAGTGWSKPQSFQNITVGAACGSWWCGPMDERNLPVSTCMDGVPNGYYKLTFKGNKYVYDFVAANHRTDFQMRPLYIEKENTLYVNIFSATPDATVKVKMEDGQELCMENVNDYDPFIAATYDQRRNLDNWQPQMLQTRHLWKITLPLLHPGVNRLEINALDVNKKQYKGYKLIKR